MAPFRLPTLNPSSWDRWYCRCGALQRLNSLQEWVLTAEKWSPWLCIWGATQKRVPEPRQAPWCWIFLQPDQVSTVCLHTNHASDGIMFGQGQCGKQILLLSLASIPPPGAMFGGGEGMEECKPHFHSRTPSHRSDLHLGATVWMEYEAKVLKWVGLGLNKGDLFPLSSKNDWKLRNWLRRHCRRRLLKTQSWFVKEDTYHEVYYFFVPTGDIVAIHSWTCHNVSTE